MQAEASTDYVAGLVLLPGESAGLAAAADGRLSLLDFRAGSRPLAAQARLFPLQKTFRSVWIAAAAA